MCTNLTGWTGLIIYLNIPGQNFLVEHIQLLKKVDLIKASGNNMHIILRLYFWDIKTKYMTYQICFVFVAQFFKMLLFGFSFVLCKLSAACGFLRGFFYISKLFWRVKSYEYWIRIFDVFHVEILISKDLNFTRKYVNKYKCNRRQGMQTSVNVIVRPLCWTDYFCITIIIALTTGSCKSLLRKIIAK